MRIVIDLQPCQSDSRHRGIGRYVTALVKAILRQENTHEIWLVLNQAFPNSIERLKRDFQGLVPKDRIISFASLSSTWEIRPDDTWRLYAAERIREYFIEQLQPDFILITSLFEGIADDAIVSIRNCNWNTKTAVIIYDFIPYLFSDSYLSNTDSKERYLRKFESLKKADLFLAISEHTRKDTVKNLLVPPQKVFNISAAVEANFRPSKLSVEDTHALLLSHGIIRPFVLYVPGGPDSRKNFSRLLEGYASLSAHLRQCHQLVIVSKMTPIDAEQLIKQATQVYSLRPNELILTGYISDETLKIFYSRCKVFIFPSLYEGFGLPVLEAMTCGAAVIGSNTSSIPEVIGLEDALFNPENSAEITHLLTRTLEDDAFLSFLKSHAHHQSQKFSWDESARLVLKALDKFQGEQNSHDLDTTLPVKKRLAWVSPLAVNRSPEKHLDFSCLEHFQHLYEITLIVDGSHDFEFNVETHSIEWFQDQAETFDRIVYVLGNAPEFKYVVELLHEVSGVVVLKDWHLGELLYQLDLENSSIQSFYQRIYQSIGYIALKEFEWQEEDNFFTNYPINSDVFNNAVGVVCLAPILDQDLYRWFGNSIEHMFTPVSPPTSEDDSQLLIKKIFDVTEKFYRHNPKVLYTNLLQSLKTIDSYPVEPTEQDLKDAAIAIAANTPSFRLPQIFVDISELVHRDAKSGIQRVVRSILIQLLTHPPKGYRIEPIYFTGSNYCYARSFTHQFLEVDTGLPDTPIEMQAGDIFLGLDLTMHLIEQMRPVLQQMRCRSLSIYFVVYDILPIQHPEWWPQGVGEEFQNWAIRLINYADGLACISESVVQDFQDWFTEKLATSEQLVPPIPIRAFHLGGDLESSLPSKGIPEEGRILLEKLENSTAFLMVGTIEPRKGHQLVLSAFKELWKKEKDVYLVIVGKIGWLMEEFVQNLTEHPEFNHHLFWLNGISDEYLDEIYARSTALIAASEGEGFGLPLIEAAKHRIPIIARDIPVFREVAGSHAYYFQGNSGEALAQVIQDWLSLREAGNIPDSSSISWITWAESCQQLLDIILN